jgi:hypothetical protein
VDRTEKTVVGAGCALYALYALVVLAFWALVIYVIAHFVLKYW